MNVTDERPTEGYWIHNNDQFEVFDARAEAVERARDLSSRVRGTITLRSLGPKTELQYQRGGLVQATIEASRGRK